MTDQDQVRDLGSAGLGLGLGRWVSLPAPLLGWLPSWWETEGSYPALSSKALPPSLKSVQTTLWSLSKKHYLQLAGSAAGNLGPYCGHIKSVYACPSNADHILPDNIKIDYYSCHNIACPNCRKSIARERAKELVEQVETKLSKLYESGLDFKYFSIGSWSPPASLYGDITHPKDIKDIRGELKQVMAWSGAAASFELLHMFRLSQAGKLLYKKERKKLPEKDRASFGKWDFIINNKLFEKESGLIEISPHFHCGWVSYEKLKPSEEVEKRTKWVYKKFKVHEKYWSYRVYNGRFNKRDRHDLVNRLSYVFNHIAVWGTTEIKEYEKKTNRGYHVLRNLTWSGLFSSQKLKLAEGYPKSIPEPVKCKHCEDQLISYEPSGGRYWHDEDILTYPDESSGLPLPTVYEILNGYSSGSRCVSIKKVYDYVLVVELTLFPPPFPEGPPGPGPGSGGEA